MVSDPPAPFMKKIHKKSLILWTMACLNRNKFCSMDNKLTLLFPDTAVVCLFAMFCLQVSAPFSDTDGRGGSVFLFINLRGRLKTNGVLEIRGRVPEGPATLPLQFSVVWFCIIFCCVIVLCRLCISSLLPRRPVWIGCQRGWWPQQRWISGFCGTHYFLHNSNIEMNYLFPMVLW